MSYAPVIQRSVAFHGSMDPKIATPTPEPPWSVKVGVGSVPSYDQKWIKEGDVLDPAYHLLPHSLIHI